MSSPLLLLSPRFYCCGFRRYARVTQQTTNFMTPVARKPSTRSARSHPPPPLSSETVMSVLKSFPPAQSSPATSSNSPPVTSFPLTSGCSNATTSLPSRQSLLANRSRS